MNGNDTNQETIKELFYKQVRELTLKCQKSKISEHAQEPPTIKQRSNIQRVCDWRFLTTNKSFDYQFSGGWL